MVKRNRATASVNLEKRNFYSHNICEKVFSEKNILLISGSKSRIFILINEINFERKLTLNNKLHDLL